MKHKEIILQFKKNYDLSSDAEVAHVLGIHKTDLSAYVNDKRNMPVPLKWRLLDHIQFSPEVKKIAAIFVDLEEHQVQMTQDLDRLEELKRRQAGMTVNFADQKWIERVESLETTQELNDMQTAKYLEMKVDELTEVKSGRRELSMSQKVLLLGLLAVKSGVNKATLKRKLNKRLEQN